MPYSENPDLLAKAALLDTRGAFTNKIKNSYSRLQVQRDWNLWQDKAGSFLATAELLRKIKHTQKATSLKMSHSVCLIMDFKLTLMLLDSYINKSKTLLNKNKHNIPEGRCLECM